MIATSCDLSNIYLTNVADMQQQVTACEPAYGAQKKNPQADLRVPSDGPGSGGSRPRPDDYIVYLRPMRYWRPRTSNRLKSYRLVVLKPGSYGGVSSSALSIEAVIWRFLFTL